MYISLPGAFPAAPARLLTHSRLNPIEQHLMVLAISRRVANGVTPRQAVTARHHAELSA